MKAVILDMYGVILKETGDGFVPYVQQTFPHLKPEEIWEPWFKADLGELSSLDVWKALGYQGDLKAIEREYLDTIEINEEFYDFAKMIRKEYKLALISNDSSRWSWYLREKFNLNQYFDVISISGDLKMKKPDERIFSYTLNKLDCQPDNCIYIDDRRFNLEAASSLGMETVLFNSGDEDYDGRTAENFIDLYEQIVLQK